MAIEIKPEEISEVLRKQITDFEKKIDVSEIGVVTFVGDGVAKIYGMDNAMYSELLDFPNNVVGMVLNLEEDAVSAVLFGEDKLIKEGDIAKRTGKVMSCPVGKELLGRVVDAVGRPIDGKGPIEAKEWRQVDVVAPGVIMRQPVNTPLQTGIKAIDSMIPIGRGQRELIIGDRQTGKSALLIDTIINQKEEGVYCIYCIVGQRKSVLVRTIDILEKYGAMDYTTIVAATASEPAPMQYIAPYTACTMGEYFRDNRMEALVCYDDLSKQAHAYRQLSLLLRRPPAREAYPGDVFYLHSRLLERASKLSDAHGAGSLTALPIVETYAGDISGYIQTNVISITDGQIFLETELFYGGIRPAINAGLSVSRVGGAAQIKAMRQVAGMLRLDLAQYRELAAFAQFASDLDKATRAQLERGRRMIELLKQDQYVPMPVDEQIMLIFAGTQGFLDDLPGESIKAFEDGFLKYIKAEKQDLKKELKEKRIIDEDLKHKMTEAITTFKSTFKSQIT